MKILTFAAYAEPRLGVLVEGGIVDLRLSCSRYSNDSLSRIFSDAKTFLSAGDMALRIAREVVRESLREKPSSPREGGTLLKAETVRLRAPVLDPQKIYCPAVNYQSHGNEAGLEPPKTPYFFTKFNNALVGHGEPIIAPKNVLRMDLEAELAVVIGRRGKYIPESEAYSHVFGYTALNDVSYRDLQVQPGWPKVTNPFGQNWIKGKGLDTSCPLGPHIVTSDELGDPHALEIHGRVNGVEKQRGNTRDMLHKIPELVSYLSQGTTLEPGDVIATGVPSRVPGVERTYLKPGDVVEVEIEGVGKLSNPVVAE